MTATTTVALRVLATSALGLALASGGCKRNDGTAPAPPVAVAMAAAPPVDGRAGPVEPTMVACPPDLAALRRAAQKIFALNEEIGPAQCTALIAGGASRWLIDLTYTAGDGQHFYVGLIEATTGQTTWNLTLPIGEPMMLEAHELVDLDGDGEPEILTRHQRAANGVAWSRLEVLSVVKGELVERAELRISYSNQRAVDLGMAKQVAICAGRDALVDGPNRLPLIVIAGDAPIGAPAPAHCPKTGRHVYRLDGEALVEVLE